MSPSTPEDPPFIPGLDLCEAYYWEAVRPIILRHVSSLPHAAALIGFGSDVIGCDTPMSRDHMWGPRMILFLPPSGFELNRALIHNALRQELPLTFRGYSTHFGPPDNSGVRLLTPLQSGPVEHLVNIQTIEAYFERELGIDPYTEPEAADWLTFQEHRLLTLTAGRVFYDDLELEGLRSRLAYYPRDVWLYLLAAQWMLISQEEPFMGRTGQNGDEVGSRIITARLVERVMRLCFLMEKHYAPYSKWFGAVFQRLKCARKMGPLLAGALNGQDWKEREQYLSQAYLLLIHMHNALDITAPMPEETSLFHERPFQVSHAEQFSEAIRNAIQDKTVRAFPPYLGSVNQFMVESSDALQSVTVTRKIRTIYH